MEQTQVLFKAPTEMIERIKDKLPEEGYSSIGELTKQLYRDYLYKKGVTVICQPKKNATPKLPTTIPDTMDGGKQTITSC